jgi:hypothetical protein
VSLPALRAVPDVRADWDTLADSAADLRTEAARARDALLDAQSSWTGLRAGYRHDGTSEQVWTGLDALGQPAGDWAAALSSARDAIDDFVATGQPLQRLHETLADDRSRLAGDRSSALASGDEAELERVRGHLIAFNDRVADLDRDWDSAQETLASALGAIRGGTAEGLAIVSAPRVETGALDWAAMTSELDTRFGGLDPRSIWRDLKGLSEGELRDWLEANPEAARALAENTLPQHPVPGSAEEVMARALSSGDAAGTRTAWLGLQEHERERLVLLFPGVVGNLNGVPLATRGRTHQVTVAGLREQTAVRLAEHEAAWPGTAPGNYHERQRWKDEKARLQTVLEGLDHAWAAYDRPHFPRDERATPGYATVFVSTQGHGQIVTMRGEPSAATDRVVTFVPGTHTTLASVDRYNDALNAMDGHDPAGTVSIYWQGTDMPRELVADNATAHVNETGAPLLAAFDRAADLELDTTGARDVDTTYVGHSAGGSMLGTAERRDLGLDATNIVYVAPAGTGHEVSSLADTSNERARRFLIQTNDDPISWAQLLGGGAQGGSFLEGSNPVHQMNAIRLESGLMEDGSLMTGHVDYFEHGSISALNIEGVVYGENVYPYLEPDVRVFPGSPYPVITYPLESDLEHFRAEGIPQVPVDSLTD